MISWLIFALLSAFLWASVNHIDKFLLSKYCKEREIGGLTIFSGLIAIPVLIMLLILDPLILSNLQFPSIILIVMSGVCYLLAIIPYLYALENDEVSTVAPQMILTTVFTMILGYLFLNETLTIIQLLGTGVIILGSLLISLDIKSILGTKFKSRMFFLMLIATSLMAINAFLFKYVAITASFISTVFWLHVGYLLATFLIFVTIKSYRRQFFKLIDINPNGIIAVNLFSEAITITGNLSLHYATLLVPLALAEVVAEGSQPFFILAISVAISMLYPTLGKERLYYKEMLLKLASIILMLIGIVMINIH